jgi:hypothetical protein
VSVSNGSAGQAPGAARRRLGVDADHDNYKWWALSCTSLGMLLATINSGTLIIALPDLERSLHTSLLTLVWVILVYMIASTVLVLSAGRLSDQFGRKRLRRRLRRLRGRVAGRRLRRQRHRADPLADPAGRRRRLPVRQRRGDRDGRVPQASSSGWRWAPTRWSRRRPRDRPGPRRRPRRDLLALGLLVQRPLRPDRQRSGAAWSCASSPAAPSDRTFDFLGTDHLRDRADRSGASASPRAGSRAGRPAGDRRPDRRRGLFLPAVRADREPPSGADARPRDLPQPPLLHGRGGVLRQRPGPLRADVRVRLLLPGRAGRLADPRRAQARAAGARDADRLAAGRHLRRPPRVARARRRWACS